MATYLYPAVSVTTLPPIGGATLGEQQLQTTALGLLHTDNSARVPTYAESLTIANTGVTTLTKPVGAKGCKVMCLLGNTANINITLDGTTPSATVGMEMQGGRSEDFIGVGDLKAICTTVATGQKISVHWYV